MMTSTMPARRSRKDDEQAGGDEPLMLPVSAKLTKDYHDKLLELRDKEKRNTSQIVRWAIEEYIDKHHKAVIAGGRLPPRG